MKAEDLKKRLDRLIEAIGLGVLDGSSDSGLAKQLAGIRYDRRGLPVGESVPADLLEDLPRLEAALQQRTHERLSLREIQELYFSILHRFFDHPYQEMLKHSLTPQQVAHDMSTRKSLVAAWEKERSEFAQGIREFWAMYGADVAAALIEISGVKAVFGGDFFLPYSSSAVGSLGLYADTIVFPDPLVKAGSNLRMAHPDKQVYLLAKHGLTALSLEDLALADTDVPIVVVAPTMDVLSDGYWDFLGNASESDVLTHLASLFGREFESYDHAQSFLMKQETVEDLGAALVDSSRLLFDTEWEGSLGEQIDRFEAQSEEIFGQRFSGGSAGGVVLPAVFGKMSQINDLLLTSTKYKATPFVSAPTVWKYLRWKLEYDVGRSDPAVSDPSDFIVTRALQVAGSTEFHMLGDIPNALLIELRQKGALSELRQVLAEGTAEMDAATDENAKDVALKVVANLEDALSAHQKDLASAASAKKRFFGIDVSGCAVLGALSFAAVAKASVPLSMAALALGTIGMPSARDLWKKGREILEKGAQLKRAPAAILLRHLRQ